jgi:hypothetical protein
VKGSGTVRGLLAALLIALVVASPSFAGSSFRQTDTLRRSADRPPRIVVMPLDVELAELTAGGLAEPNAEWTAAAEKHVHGALENEAQARGAGITLLDLDRTADQERQAALDLVAMHRAVGQSILLHQYTPGHALPSKQGRFDWSLGPDAESFGRVSNADYAMFIFLRDNYASAGRMAVMVTAAMLGIGVPGGSQVGFASLVDLQNGNIVWFNRLVRATGDLRTPEAAADTVRILLSDSPR